ncbi:multicopper oxidase CueO [Ruegeria arenilitoris]|uniref:multicopper oxidase CueO n=1 Tax=Ruegeria arenilitoris TaxID=1173585 RepID=UPI00147C54F7|nr:multicopper oxidase CueO [Ruegeria arenilitoris]
MLITPTRRSFVAGGAACSASVLLPMASHLAAADTRPQLQIPPELFSDGKGEIHLAAQSGTMQFGRRTPTPTYGFNGPFLGPAVRLRRGEDVVMHVKNALPEPTTVHWHGLIIPGDADGGPHQVIQPADTWRVPLIVDQPAATLWFHPHIYPATAELVIKGLAGLLLVSDEESDGLGLPSHWGVDDIPLIIQDRRFKPDGSFFHRFNLAAVTVGYVGDTPLVNGSTYPIAKTAQGWLRLRILNGSNARSYRLAASDNRSIHVIGSDGGLLEHHVSMNELLVHAGERFEVLVDARDGQSFDLVTLPVDQPIMRLPPFDKPLPLITIDPTGAEGAGTLPDALVTLPSIPTTPPPLSQSLTMNMNRDDEGMGALMKAGLKKLTDGSTDASVAKKLTEVIVDGPTLSQAERSTANGVNGSSFALDAKPFSVKQNTLLRWRIDENSDTMLHPVHIHGCQFRVLSMDDNPPPAHLAGWKDTVAISKGGVAEILVNFPHAAEARTPYMTHCHILEHEDSGMMAQFTVS